MKTFLNIFYFFLLLVGFGAIAFFADSPEVAGTVIASMMVIGSVGDISDKYTFGKNISAKVYLICVDQINDQVAFPSPDAQRNVSNITLKAGEYMQYFESHTVPTLVGTAEKGDITSSGSNTFVLIMAGDRDVLKTFGEDFLGKKFVLIFKEIESSGHKIIGSLERGVTLKSFEFKNDSDGRYATFTFERESILQSYNYVGALVLAPAAVHTADATALGLTASQARYEIPENTAATAIATVSGLTSSDKGRIITLIGKGVDHPATIADSSTFILEDGATWTARLGSSISFRVVDASTLVEVHGSRVQTA